MSRTLTLKWQEPHCSTSHYPPPSAPSTSPRQDRNQKKAEKARQTNTTTTKRETKLAHLPNIQCHPSLKRRTRRVPHDPVHPRVLVATRLKQDMHMRRVSLLGHHDGVVIVRVQGVDGIRAEDALGVS